MQITRCPTCGRETAPDEAACCGQAPGNGAAAKKKWIVPPPPPEAANWVIEPVPPEMADEFRRTFDEREFLAEMRETLETGGADIDALVAEIERKVNGRT